jgi:Flp pilus assembly protein TadD
MISFAHGQRLLYACCVTFAIALAGCESTPKAHDPYADAGAAEAMFEKSANRPPTPRTLRAMARILTAQGKDDQASYVLQSLMRQHPTYLPAYNDMAELHLRFGRVDEALASINQGLKLAPHDATLWNNRGMCRLMQGDYDQALQAFDAAVEAAPHDARYHANRATALGLLGRYDESLASFRKAVSPGEAHHNLAVLCEARGDAQRAEQEHVEAARLGFAVDRHR